ATGSQRVYGENVLLIVLESTRADYWAEPELAPNFHRWKERGLYFPRAVAQYPATPLAYGAMFASQPPTVLAQSPYWSDNRLFDYARPKFDDLILTRPKNRWFDHNAITDFFMPSDIAPYGHKDGQDGLEYARGRLEMLDDDESFFGWVHLYEPHAPYDARPDFAHGGGKRAAYRSEIAWLDDRLGSFMDWFYDSRWAEDTMVIVVGDHGEGMGDEVFGEPFWGHHVHVHEVVNRVPLFVSGPSLPEGAEEDEVQVSQLDVMPTIFDFVGLDMPRQSLAQGSSVYGLIDERPTRPIVTEAFSIRGTKFFNFVERAAGGDRDEIAEAFHKISTEGSRYAPKIALQYGPHKLVYDRMLRRYWLYDTERDPMEKNDLSEERPELLETMKARLDDWALAQNWAIDQLNERLVD
ncbi:MAG: sulfatase-like hydrolase/transferase, partial [Persicimonas sp.]